MKVDKSRLVFTSALLLFALFIVIASFSYGPSARMVPLLVGIIALVLLVPITVNEIYPLRLINQMDVSWMSTDIGNKGDKSEKSETRPSPKQMIGLMASIIGFFLLVLLLGFQAGIPLFTVFFLKIWGKANWLKTIAIAAIVALIIIFAFEVLMGFRLYRGIVFGEIIPAI